MPAKILSVISPKGGSGKTITAINLSRVLAGLNKRTLIIDADASTNGLSLFFLDEIVKAKQENGLENGTLFGSFESGEIAAATPIEISDKVSIIPATFTMNQTEHADPARFEAGLRSTLRSHVDRYDYIFVDSQAGTDEFASIAVECSTEVIIVSEYDPMSSQGIERMRILFQNQISDKPTWVLFNKVLPEFASAIGDFLAVARYLSPIPWDADVVRAYVRRRSPIDMSRGNLHTMAVIQTTISLLGNEIERAVDEWKRGKERIFKEPAREALEDIDRNINSLEEQKIKQQYAQQDFERMIRITVGTIPAIIAVQLAAFIYYASIKGIFLPEDIIGVGVSAGVIMMLIVALLPILRSRLFRRKQVRLDKEINALEKSLKDLREQRDKYKSILDSDISSLVRQPE